MIITNIKYEHKLHIYIVLPSYICIKGGIVMKDKSTKNQLMVQTTTGEQLAFIFKYNNESIQKEEDLLKNILVTRVREMKS